MTLAGRKHEMATEGGEVTFVKKIIEESKLYQNKIQIFTVMLGRKKSSNELKHILKNEPSIKSISASEFCQGRIMRWGLAWTFNPNIHLEKAEASSFATAKLAKKNTTPFVLSLDKGARFSDNIHVLNTISELLVNELKATDIVNEKVNDDICAIRFKLNQPSWRHQRNKRREQERSLEGPANKKRKEDVLQHASSDELLLDVSLSICTDHSIESSAKFVLNFVWKDGTLGKNGLYELVQYFRNKLKS